MRCEPGTDPDGSEELELPELDGVEGDDGSVDEPVEELALPESGEPDPEDEGASDWFVPEISPAPGTSPALGEDEPEGPVDPDLLEQLPLAAGEGSLLDDGTESAAIDEDSVGVEPMPEAGDRSDADGLDDPGAERLVDQPLPVLDQGDDEPLDVGIEIPIPAEPLDGDEGVSAGDAVPASPPPRQRSPEGGAGAAGNASAQSAGGTTAAGSATNRSCRAR